MRKRGRTSNVERRTSNVEVGRRRASSPRVRASNIGVALRTLFSALRRSTFDVRRSTFAAAFFLTSSPLTAADPPLLQQATQALAEAIPQVAIQKLQRFLAATNISPADRAEATRKLSEALLAGGRNEDALAAIEPLVNTRDPAALLLRAEILEDSARWAEALPMFHALAAAPDAPLSAKLGEAEALHATGQTAKAITLLEQIVVAAPAAIPARLRLAGFYVEAQQAKKARAALAAVKPARPEDSKWKELVEGRLLLLEGHAADAIVTFDQVLKNPQHLSEEMLVVATLGVTDAGIITEGYDAADRSIENFIWRNPDSVHLERMFQRLDDMYAHEDDPRENELQKWAQKPPARRAALARFYLARLQTRAQKLEKAKGTLDTFVQAYPAHPLLPEVQEMLADWHLKKGDFVNAIRALEAAERGVSDDEARAAIELRSGLVHYRAGEYLLAANLFDSVAKRAPKLRETALYNGALAALNQRNFDGFLERYRELTAQFPESLLRSEIVLEQGLLQARSRDARAEETLLRFLQHFPKHARTAEARLALAELALNAGEPIAAETYRQIVNDALPPAEITDQSQYLAIFLADTQTPRRDPAVIELATKFLRERPHSSLVPEVRMKLGQVYFRTSDFPNAETQFSLLATENADGPYAETALFLAGQAAMNSINTGSVDRALGLFDQVVKRDGPMKLYARQQQAIAQGRLGNETEAVALYDIILATQPPPDAELGFAARAGKGDNLLALGRKDPKQLGLAIEVFDQLANLPDVTPAWRNQALYKKGKTFEQLARIPEALTAFYDVLEVTAADSREFLWYYKAGFDAARIFEAQDQWKSAIGIYSKMAKLEGPRAAEAKERMRQLRLEHFIWE